MKRKYKFITRLILLVLLFCCIFSCAFASVLTNWNDSKAYKPKPILFLHGFNSSPGVWSSAISGLSQWFTKYQAIGTYLEIIDFQDRWGSIDTYANGDPGWADRLNIRVQNLLSANQYGSYTNKLNLVAWSMGGLAAREFLTASKYPSGYIDKMILIGVPNLGSPLATYVNNLATNYRVGSNVGLPISTVFSSYRNSVDSIAQNLFIQNLESLPATIEMAPGSKFLNTLNSRLQPSTVKYYGIEGIIGSMGNSLLFHDFYGGDEVVSKDSQVGKGYVSFQVGPRIILASHLDEPAVSAAGDNPLLKFLDFDPPQFAITSPSPSGTTEIYEASVYIQGEVYREYLPADSQLHLRVIKQEDGSNILDEYRQNSIKPSSLWIPNNPDSPVAEFNELINFPGPGTYKISSSVKNPAGAESDIKDVFVKVTITNNAYIIVHCHNPEGYEINSIQGVMSSTCRSVIYDGNISLGLGAYNNQTHNQPILVSKGSHLIKAVFNGITKEETIDLKPNETKTIVFTFERTDFDISSLFSINKSVEINDPGIAYLYAPTIGSFYYGLYSEAQVPPGYSSRVAYVQTFGDTHPAVYPVPASLTGNLSVSGNINSYSASARLNARWDITMDSLRGYGVEVGLAVLGNSSVNVPVETAFYNWFIQLKEIPTQRGFDTVYLGTSTNMRAATIMPRAIYLNEGNRYYFMAVSSSQINYTQLNMESLSSKFHYQWYIENQPIPLNSNTWSFSYDFPAITMLEEGSLYKMSSVPYDLTGTGI
ncbi:MAG: hypothetical protein PHY94_02465 [Candidatus Omnitrophica bacterium]|nr:hypothetical protein [Candidatus Omnitrophota bacterium]